MTRGAVDAHVHLWDLGRMRLSWFRGDLGLPAVAAVEDLRRASEGADTPIGAIGSAIAVQAGDTQEELGWVTALRHPLLAGVVQQYDPDETAHPDGRPDSPTDAASGSWLRGVRAAVPSRLSDLSDVRGLDELSERSAHGGDVVEFLIRAEQLPAVAALAARHPDTHYVLCHLGLGAGDPDPVWEDGLRLAAARPNVYAKVSGLVTTPAAESGDRGADAADDRLRRCLAVAVDALGGRRLIFGSDWPMSARVDRYERIVERLRRALPPLGPDESVALWGGTARELYRL